MQILDGQERYGDRQREEGWDRKPWWGVWYLGRIHEKIFESMFERRQ